MLPNEHVFHGKRDINYLFQEGAKSSPFLLVAFQAVPTVRNGEAIKSYNYTKFLRDINVHRLFIEDTCGKYGCYYLCNNMSFDVEETVIELIESIMQKYDIKKENVITFGSSKGGSAALYYGLKYGFGHIISGAPQSKIAEYLNGRRTDMLQYMIGDDLLQENIDKLDSLILDLIKPEVKTKINLLTSEKDAQYKKHIIPLIEAIEKAKLDANIVFEKGIENHRDIATFFPNFLVQLIREEINKAFGFVEPDFECRSKSFSLTESNFSEEMSAVIRLVSNKGEVIAEKKLGSGETFEFETNELLAYSAVHSVCIGDTPIYSVTLCDSMLDQGYFDYNGYSMKFNNESKELEFRVDIDKKFDKTAFAFALIKGKDVVVPNFHSVSPCVSFPISESGTYVVRFTIKLKGIGALRQNSERYPISIDQEVN